MNNEFKGVAFVDAENAKRQLESLFVSNREGLARHVRQSLAESASADRVLTRLVHFLETGDGRSTILDLMARSLRYTRLLFTLLDQSQYLTDIICRSPEYMTWLWVEAKIDPTWARKGLLAELRQAVNHIATFEGKCAEMRRFHRREMLRIGARDVFNYAPIPSITQDLANVADAMLEVALESAEIELQGRYGAPMCSNPDGEDVRSEFVIIGMGKLGGRELNFSSDIDLIFIYSNDGETTGKSPSCAECKSISNAEYFSKLGEVIIKALSEQTDLGSTFRVDMRLRPHGTRGPLVMSLSSTLYYYESEGLAWERQALIKARPCAGSIELGDTFIDATRPFVFPRYFDDETLEEIRGVKARGEQRVAQEGKTDIEIKLGRGGIRDIEFAVQLLQLLNGGRIPEVRNRNTVEAIDALGRHGILSAFEALSLSRNYVFLRQIEHRVQIEGSLQRHVLPSDPDALDDLARKLGYKSGEAFMVGYRDRANETREILERFFDTEGSGNLWIGDLLNPHSEAGEGLRRLADAGFRDPSAARDELFRLHRGPNDRPHSVHVRQQFIEILPLLLDSLSCSHDPDLTFARLGQMLANLKAPSAIYDILKHSPGLSGALVTLVSNSHYLSDFIIRDPGLFETFGHGDALKHEQTEDGLKRELALLRSAYDPHVALHRLQKAEFLRIGMRDLLDKIDILTVGRELTLVAELCLQETLAEARAHVAKRHGAANADFSILALGKFGGREMGYGSDMDLIYIFDGNGEAPHGQTLDEYYSAVANRLTALLHRPTTSGTLYEVDARLRPYGKHGPLSLSLSRLEEYHRGEAQAWERLALCKARVVAGDAAFGEKVQSAARACAFDAPLTGADVHEFDNIRQRLAALSAPLDLKRGEGGMGEIEFAVRLLQIRSGQSAPEVHGPNLLEALTNLHHAGLVGDDDAGVLREAFLTFRRIENRMRMMTGRSHTALPVNVEERRDLSARLGFAEDVADVFRDHAAKVHRVYQALLDDALA